ncbi:hypothetical protein KORDIASMS9_02278 [Kordia sp. SMS9]|uniref:hypothetical protein n=1 Tax=Kordia sp. SMS9 TaxID=2282170 RepID=UPI000E1049AC|nr:hypothetical protein [Kordia sp. SMS9]AXG70049.1 hypothetical protein KORDIASMS9_02278 [Kordia sp. SMS9]
MGLNIAGIAINKSYKEDVSTIESMLGHQLLFEKEVPFEEACESFKEDSYCDIYFSENSTFILCDMERAGFEFILEEQDVFSFVLSEMTMTFCINYVKNGKLVRTIVEAEDELHEDEGTPLEFEKTEDDKSEIIYYLIEKTIGKSFDDIDLEATCKRYTFQSLQQSDTTETNGSKKPWWKFW